MGMNNERWLARLKPAPDSAIADNMRRGKGPFTDMVHLLWSFWLFVTPLFSNEGFTLNWVCWTLVTYPIFLALYMYFLRSSRRAAGWASLAIVALTFVALRWYPSATTYFVYGCLLQRFAGQGIARYLWRLVMLNACYVGLTYWFGYPWQVSVMMPAVTFIIATIIAVETMSEEKDAALRLSQEEIRKLAATAERERIGRDLHDLLGHTLSLITLKLELSRRLFDRDPEAARREMADAEQVARHALAEVRSAVTGIRATDLAAELASVRLLLESCHTHVDYVLPPLTLPPDTERGLALVLREAATNISRHAQASHVSIVLESKGGELHVQVRDNGRGGVMAHGNGLTGMQERVRALGGRLEIVSPRGEGTRLTIVLPLPVRARIETNDDVPSTLRGSA